MTTPSQPAQVEQRHLVLAASISDAVIGISDASPAELLANFERDALAAVQKKLDEAYKALFYVGVHAGGHMPPIVMRQVEIARVALARAAQGVEEERKP